ncbi:MAG: hypothetical protein NTW46_02985 [Candidatus Nealsonbacteria bacterium]|nr:hypothetical protein [Candidatus Nealsonbacteria bacterium]
MKKTLITIGICLAAVSCLVLNIYVSLAYSVEDLNFENKGDIVVGPGKAEFFLSPGEKTTKEITISNRSGMKKKINIDVEDFAASADSGTTVDFLGKEKGRFSLKDYVKPEITEIILEHGQRLRLPVEIDIPLNADPGGLYGAVMISASNITEPGSVEDNTASMSAKLVTRVASLFFVRVKGDVNEDGALRDFKALKSFYEKGSIPFNIAYENKGSVHESPYGIIEIRNMLGKKIDEVQVDPWFVMPDSIRTREVKWERGGLFGRYTATLTLNRGYMDILDTKEFSFWVIPWKLALVGLAVLFLFIWLLVWIAGHFELKKK